jgi:integrase
MASVFKPRNASKYVILYHDENGHRRKVTGTTDKVVSQQIANDIENEIALLKRGIIDRKAIGYRDQESRSLADHISDWQADLLAKGYTPKHAGQTTDRLRRLVAVMSGAIPDEIDCKRLSPSDQEKARQKIDKLDRASRLSNLTTERVQSGLAVFRQAGRSAQTCNHYRAAVRAFSRWCLKTGRVREDLTPYLATYSVKEDPRHDRRTISIEELQRLVQAAHAGPHCQGMPGPVRALCYRLAVSTGLRLSELKGITPASFDWEDRKVIVEACYTKNGETAELFLPDDLADDLRRDADRLELGAIIFPLPGKAAAMLRVDLKAAGIPYRDQSGRVFDFHALRCQCATLADQAGVSPRVVQRLMRHSKLELTGRYTRPRAVDIENAARSLASLATQDQDQSAEESSAMTGTDGRIMHSSGATEEDVDGCNSWTLKTDTEILLRSIRRMALA